MHRSTGVCTIAVLVFAAAPITARRAEAQLHLKAGFSGSTISFSPASGSPELTHTRRRSGFVGGASVLLPGNRAGGWQIEALVIQKGARNLLRVDDAMDLTYLEIPALVHIDALRGRLGALFLLAGPSMAFNLQASYEDDGMREGIREDISKLDIGLHLGVGVEFGPATLDARYVWGMRRVFHDSDLEGAFRNRTFVATAGLRLGR